MENQEADLAPQGDFLTGLTMAVAAGLGAIALVAATVYGFKLIDDYEGARITALVLQERREQAALNEKIAAHYAALLTSVELGRVTVLIDGKPEMACRAR